MGLDLNLWRDTLRDLEDRGTILGHSVLAARRGGLFRRLDFNPCHLIVSYIDFGRGLFCNSIKTTFLILAECSVGGNQFRRRGHKVGSKLIRLPNILGDFVLDRLPPSYALLAEILIIQ